MATTIFSRRAPPRLAPRPGISRAIAFTIQAPPDRTTAMAATTESPARQPADERSAMNVIVAVEGPPSSRSDDNHEPDGVGGACVLSGGSISLAPENAAETLTRPRVIASRTMAAVTSSGLRARRAPVICVGVVPPQTTAT